MITSRSGGSEDVCGTCEVRGKRVIAGRCGRCAEKIIDCEGAVEGESEEKMRRVS